MKCDELKPLIFSIADLAYIDEFRVTKNFQNPHDHSVYKATEVDAAITELKARIHELESIPHTDNSAVIERLSNENERLVKCCKEYDSRQRIDERIKFNGAQQLRATKRALWIARAYRAGEHYRRYHGIYICPLAEIPEYQKWLKVEHKCRAKAKEYE